MAVASFATLLAGAAQAAEQQHGLSGEKASFPPFDPTHFASNLFWLAITFAVLYWLMSTVALPRLGAILEERADTIGRDLDHATQMQGKAEEMAQAYEKALAEARKNAQGIAQTARETGAKASDAQRHATEAELAAKLAQAEATIAKTKTEAMTNVRGLGSDIAVAIVEKLTGQAPSASEASAAVDQALSRG
ncbi:F0F1 ATP synthase subunit B family protein [Bosea sp. NBC_00550]|uniref:F0F1 ATP synthase subunit B family protein n=1 Tax=Bosea sp. NBC_00550 TaxID=2969621 RepID=UPI00222E21FD|nr:F0F1 ATP synthase subunit B' [Bosea sp. NBC_00550]UZF92514.1 F0F1 ATP synthase subunit B' [Bosea sp. NBC_00550]